jgi:hypothetical protein
MKIEFPKWGILELEIPQITGISESRTNNN